MSANHTTPQRPDGGANPRIRAEVAALRARPSADVVVIGGGINGIATFRDLALQGVDVVLVERDDFVSGASSASSHMIHGGIRYLEHRTTSSRSRRQCRSSRRSRASSPRRCGS